MAHTYKIITNRTDKVKKFIKRLTNKKARKVEELPDGGAYKKVYEIIKHRN